MALKSCADQDEVTCSEFKLNFATGQSVCAVCLCRRLTYVSNETGEIASSITSLVRNNQEHMNSGILRQLRTQLDRVKEVSTLVEDLLVLIPNIELR